MLFVRLVGQALDRFIRPREGGLSVCINVEFLKNGDGKLVLLMVGRTRPCL
ncbi:MAG: hypothetical protein Q8Q52_03560 [Acidimicrobiia bacterium]|nr:hypothetical protein [Acidimicrobiia bacterium]